MKIRTDFVTNSSSSSFIIGKKDDADVTVESVYQTIKKLYLERRQKYFEMFDYAKNQLGLNVEMVHTESYGGRNIIECGHINYDTAKKLEAMFGYNINFDDLPDNDYVDNKWAEVCETYDDYVKYWSDKINTSTDEYICAPFIIFDYSIKSPLVRIDLGKEGIEDGLVMPEYDQTSDILQWYYNDIEEAFNDEEYGYYEIYSNRGTYEELKNRIKRENIPQDDACLYLLGKVCVYGVEGCYMPQYVISRLKILSQYSCSHMG